MAHVEPEIGAIAKAILKKAGVGDRLPTPVDDIVACADLVISEDISLEPEQHGFLSKSLGILKSALRKAIGLVDLRENIVYLDLTTLPTRQAFVKLHEVGHKLIPWQREAYLFVDDDRTLSPEIDALFESEANHFAAEVLFQGDRFDSELRDYPLELKSALALSKRYGASVHATIRRYVERHHRPCAVLVLDRDRKDRYATFSIRTALHSREFIRRFGGSAWPADAINEQPFVREVAFGRRLFQSEMTLFGLDGSPVACAVEVFDNSYNVFALVIPVSERRGGNRRKRIVVVND